MQPRQCVGLLLTLSLAAGCNKPATVKTYPVTGAVTVNGKVIEGAIVTLTPTIAGGPNASGKTDSEGKFKLTTYAGPGQVYAGAAAGDYKVIITKPVPPEGPSTEDMQNMSPEARQAAMMKMMQGTLPTEGAPDGGNAPKKPAKPKSEVPERYGKAETSGLTATVLSGVNDPLEFKLTE